MFLRLLPTNLKSFSNTAVVSVSSTGLIFVGCSDLLRTALFSVFWRAISSVLITRVLES